MRILLLALTLFALQAVAAQACDACHGRRHHHHRHHARYCCDGDHHDRCDWHAHRRWFRRSHRHDHCDEPEYVYGRSLKDFPLDPVDGQKAWVRGVRWEWDEDDNRWERD